MSAVDKTACAKCEKRQGVFWVPEENAPWCAVCSKKKKNREELKIEKPVNRTVTEKKRAVHTREAYESAKARGGSREGWVEVGGIIGFAKLGSTPNPKVLSIFPNFKHGSRTDGLGLPSLSPKSIGPIPTNQPAPFHMCLNLENFHQGSKYFGDCENLLTYMQRTHQSETLPTRSSVGETPEEYLATKKDTFLDSEPHRHKAGMRGKVPTCSVWQDSNGEVHFIDYVQSRQFYCVYYERSLTGVYNELGERHRQAAADYQHLLDLQQDSVDMKIWGYDGYPIVPTAAAVRAQYLDTSLPFGHEAVLFAMLALPPAQWPWKEFTTFTF
eukprot:TRINITY_DN406_c0_g2_i1.p1 TRINITY_DN406_c0_g2~~TRINITY_DN406_c0_g2_i1.p1  ORF type:complete len:327 (+),score=62.61 TRINITY_DN406_c0_g2_i1:77-1057(+)